MNFWHIQLHEGDFKGFSNDDIRKILSYNLIGCSGEPVGGFNKIEPGDIVLVRHGGTVLALVQAITKARDILPEEKDENIWFDRCITIKVLDEYENLKISGEGWYIPKTLMPVDIYNSIAYNFILNLYNEVKMQEYLELIQYKKQIILQGPPGTGKTKLAKEIARELVGLKADGEDDPTISEKDIINALENVSKIRTVAGNVEYELIKVDSANKSVTLKKSTETEAATTFSKIIEFYSNKLWQTSVANNDDRRAAAIAGYIFQNKTSWQKKAITDQVKIIQFHPSYSYEDFVRGITAKPNQEEGGGVIYKVENKILAEFAERALKNYRQSSPSPDIEINSQSEFKQQLEIFIDQVNDAIDKNGFYEIGPDTTAKIVGITDSAFIYSFDKRPDIRYQLLYSDLIKIDSHPQKVKRTLDVRDIAVGYLTMIGKHPYYFKVYNLIKSIQSDAHTDAVRNRYEEGAKNYVLIIDEINRANLSAVLGELIYAMEYRSKAVESMYSIDNDNKLLLPPNLYIIGTMNTADRSVGHIDYAIRRRFAFVDVLPKDLSGEPNIKFDLSLFNSVKSLFTTDDYKTPSAFLSPEFEPSAVALGHSYFIDKSSDGGSMTVRLEYEIKPILKEYVRDGVLVGEGVNVLVENLKATI